MLIDFMYLEILFRNDVFYHLLFLKGVFHARTYYKGGAYQLINLFLSVLRFHCSLTCQNMRLTLHD